ncbi:MAG: tRNA (adenosine(37)-N6)-dimethylallyltransferase MiaA [Nitrospira sp.]|nr:tRNA (adenosine(37)-N6)-dimethylallyltransferase MiaA [Nitrospira sp.]
MVITRLPPAIFLTGPTASGKTSLAMQIAAEFPVDIVSVDAAQVYRGLDIGTAKPNLEERTRFPHRLIDICEPSEIYSAADFRVDALRAMQEITAAGRIPLLVGGTLFYFRALEKGLPDLPAADPELRKSLLHDADTHGWDVLYERLRSLDPERAKRIHPNDPQRILRALEIIHLSGKTASGFRDFEAEPLPYEPIKIQLYPNDRTWLHARINRRFQEMLDQGFLDEAQQLFLKPGLHPDLPSMRTVGYRQAGLYLSKKINYDALINLATTATRQLAKRQLTWMRGEQGAERFDCSAEPNLFSRIREILFARLRQ